MQDGLLLCTAKCVDNELVWLRDRIIRETLRFPREEPEELTSKIRRHPNIVRR